MVNSDEKKQRGRPKCEMAESHDAIIEAVYQLLHEKSVYDLTIEEIAKKAKVGKPTIYKWWSSKAALVMDMFQERVVPDLSVPPSATAEAAIRRQVGELIRLLNGFFGKVSADLIAEGQCDSSVLDEYRKRYQGKRRKFSQQIVERGIANGEFRKDIDADLLIDMLYGPIYYRLLVKHQPLDAAFGEKLVDEIMRVIRAER